jgi:hypothetical protein
MRTILTGALVAGLLCCFAVAQDSDDPKGKPAQAAAGQDSEVYVAAYKLGDLPVWSKAGVFEPDVLMWLIQSSVNPKSWDGAGGASSMAPYKQNASLVISTTAANHDAVKRLIERLRK